ncbi:hypothetical protein NC652_002349 [Populus alba x Populus x berolinensis]|uniref:Plastocyanin-like domain-containing protein n=1 Tax=Populus alba x Populus x berolinensis TaxID=444605 RepID=A0AAD6RQH5_9ROSI|nr:hypothetical protein NC652_002349 [Populus alba x Populus x berolinensis]KAJ7012357.1 hypothetical protein NC653_002419 [Populus alba x Populus x berolinensis]
MYSSPDGLENVVMSINGKFPGPTIRARAGDTVHVHLTNKLHTEGVVIHWHGIRQRIGPNQEMGSQIKKNKDKSKVKDAKNNTDNVS